jgi:hypothetical protein
MSDFVAVRLIGGLGNQMFQYAMGRSLAAKYGAPLVLDKSEFHYYRVHPFLLDQYRLAPDAKLISRATLGGRLRTRAQTWRLGRLSEAKVYSEPHFHFSPAVFDSRPPVTLDGYWQSPRYFEAIRDRLVEDFTIKTPPSAYLKASSEKFAKLRAEGKTIVGLHFRRGDYVSNPQANKVHGTCENDYYLKALAFLLDTEEARRRAHVVVFSDEPDWVRDNFDSGLPTSFQSNPDPLRPFEDIQLMKECDHLVMANSSFSWWGAWLGARPGRKVVAPKQWFRAGDTKIVTDLYDPSWVQL